MIYVCKAKQLIIQTPFQRIFYHYYYIYEYGQKQKQVACEITKQVLVIFQLDLSFSQV